MTSPNGNSEFSFPETLEGLEVLRISVVVIQLHFAEYK